MDSKQSLETNLYNIAPLADVTISSKSPWSTDDDEREILTADHDRMFSFHTALEDSPYIILDLKRDFVVTSIRIVNRLDVCKEKAKSLRIEWSHDRKNWKVLSDINEIWDDQVELSVKNIDTRFLKFSIKEKHYFHLKKIEIFTNLEFLYHALCVDNGKNKILEICELKEILRVCDLIYKEYYGRFIVSFSEINKIILSSKSNIQEDIKYKLAFINENEIIFSIEIINKHYKDPDFYFFITTKSQKFDYKFKEFDDDKFCLMKKITSNQVIDEIKLSDNIIKSVRPFLKVINSRKIVNGNKYKRDRNNIIIIDPDLIVTGGFADKLRGILSIIKLCNSMNIDFFIKFNEPFMLNTYYEFKDYSTIEPSRLEEDNHYRLPMFLSPLPWGPFITDFSLKEVLLNSMKFYNIITLGTNLVFSPNEYKNIFSENFKKTDFLEEKISYYRNKINGEYVSISLRFLNCLGDFNETSISNPLNENEQIYLMKKCKSEIIKFMETIDRKCVVLSDSSRFLNYVSDIPNVYVFPENIMHIGKCPGNIDVTVTEDAFVRTIIDFNLIMEASHIYRFSTMFLHPYTGFPWLASLCSGKPFSEHKF